MLTGGVEEADGNSIMVVGLPEGRAADGDGMAASAPEGIPAATGGIAGATPHDPE